MELYGGQRSGPHPDRPSLPTVTPHTRETHLLSSLQGSVGNHAVQRLLAGDTAVQLYRRRGAMNFGVADGALVERRFRNSQKQPWLSLITVNFDSVVTDIHGRDIPMGMATAKYFSNSHALASFSVLVTGGPVSMPTIPGTFTVHRMEGVGYNDADTAAGMSAGELEGPKRGGHRRYTKPTKSGDRPATMHLAVFFNHGAALHIGGNNIGSHGCIHVDDWAMMTQLNYHSVIGRTKVNVNFSGTAKATFAP